jgi:hypothetical protein
MDMREAMAHRSSEVRHGRSAEERVSRCGQPARGACPGVAGRGRGLLLAVAATLACDCSDCALEPVSPEPLAPPRLDWCPIVSAPGEVSRVCAEGLECLESSRIGGPFCTMRCETLEECPLCTCPSGGSDSYYYAYCSEDGICMPCMCK